MYLAAGLQACCFYVESQDLCSNLGGSYFIGQEGTEIQRKHSAKKKNLDLKSCYPAETKETQTGVQAPLSFP